MQKFPQDSGLVEISNKPLDLGMWNLIRKRSQTYVTYHWVGNAESIITEERAL